MKALAGLVNYAGIRYEPLLKRKAVVLGEELPVDLQQDRVYAALIITHEWVVTPTFAAGSPKLNPRGITHGVLKKLEVERAAGDVFKKFRGTAQLVDQLALMAGEPAAQRYKVNSSSLNGSELTGAPQLGATTVPVAVRETFPLWFANLMTSNPEETMFNTEGITTAKLRINYGAAADVQDPSDATACTFALTGYVTILAITADHKGDKNDFDDWIQSYDETVFTTTQGGSSFEFKPQGELLGMWLRAYKIVSGKRVPLNAEELRNFQVKIEYNKNFVVDTVDLAQLQDVNGCGSSIEEYFPGAVYVDLKYFNTYGSGLQTVPASGFKPLNFTVSTPSSIDHATNPVVLVAEYDLIKAK